MIGIITYYNPAKRFGFIRSAGADYFFHASNVEGFDPQIQKAVSFEVTLPIAIGKREQATHVRLAEKGGDGGAE